MGCAEKLNGIVRISEIAKADRKLFSRIAYESYSITDWICADYPEHFEWFFGKTLPDVLLGKREIVSYYIDDNIAGTVFLKKRRRMQNLHAICLGDFPWQGCCNQYFGSCV